MRRCGGLCFVGKSICSYVGDSIGSYGYFRGFLKFRRFQPRFKIWRFQVRFKIFVFRVFPRTRTHNLSWAHTGTWTSSTYWDYWTSGWASTSQVCFRAIKYPLAPCRHKSRSCKAACSAVFISTPTWSAHWCSWPYHKRSAKTYEIFKCCEISQRQWYAVTCPWTYNGYCICGCKDSCRTRLKLRQVGFCPSSGTCLM